MKKALTVVLCISMLGSFASLFAGCSKTDAGEVNVYNWGDYAAEGQYGLMNVIDEFEKETGIKVNYTSYETNEDLYNMLKNSNVSYDVVVPSDYMISKMIKEGMLLEINYDNIPNYQYINNRFKHLAKLHFSINRTKHNIDSHGFIFCCFGKLIRHHINRIRLTILIYIINIYLCAVCLFHYRKHCAL